MAKRTVFFLTFLLCTCLTTALFAENLPNNFKTRYASVYYDRNEDVVDFIWRLGGSRIEFPADKELAASRVDRVIERVEAILDMRPRNFRVSVYLHREALGPNSAAYYDIKSKSIHISIEYASDGVFAHEAAHAVINQYFPHPTPMKIQEILTQYVDKYLWSDY